ncbi:MAG: MFS transporter, partial [Vicinamibacterales bacterium]
ALWFFAGSFALLVGSRLLAGVMAGNLATVSAVVADVTSESKRTQGMGIMGAAIGLGFIFGPAIGGFLSQWGYQAPSFFASALSLANFMAAWFLLPESRSVAHAVAPRASRMQTLRQAIARPGLPPLLLIYFVVVAAFASFESTFALYTERRFDFGASTIGYVFAFVGIVLSIVQGLLVGRVVPRVGEHRVVPAAIFVLAAGLALLPLASSVVMLLVACGLLAVGMGFHTPSLMALISRRSDAATQGGVLGLSQSLASLARVVGPAWGGWLYDHHSIAMPYVSAAGLMGVAFLLSLAVLTRAPLSRAPVSE